MNRADKVFKPTWDARGENRHYAGSQVRLVEQEHGPRLHGTVTRLINTHTDSFVVEFTLGEVTYRADASKLNVESINE